MNHRGFATLFYKELLRFHKVFLQTVVAPIVTALLYLVVFAHALAEHVTVYDTIDYTAFLMPGLIMMTILQNAFANSSSSVIQSKVTGNILFVLVAPLSHLEFYLAFVLAALVRGLVVGCGVYAATLPLVPLHTHNVAVLVGFAILGGAILGTLGLIAGIWAEKFDQLAGFQNFIVLPLTFLSGVFYSIHSLPPLWQGISRWNPFFYLIDGFRYGFFGRSDVDPTLSAAVTALALLVLGAAAILLLKRGYRLRS